MQVRATANGLRISSRRIGLVASLIKGRAVSDAETILDHTPKKGAGMLKKLVLSAKANAVNNHAAKPATLVIDSINIGPGQSMKRYRAAARGQALPFKRHSSNVTVILQADKVKKGKDGSKD